MKTTGVSDIPKFGLLDFLGHPSQQCGFVWKSTMWICEEGSISDLRGRQNRGFARKAAAKYPLSEFPYIHSHWTAKPQMLESCFQEKRGEKEIQRFDKPQSWRRTSKKDTFPLFFFNEIIVSQAHCKQWQAEVNLRVFMFGIGDFEDDLIWGPAPW